MTDFSKVPPNQPEPAGTPPSPQPTNYRKVAATNGRIWLKEAWLLFKKRPGTWLGCAAVFFTITLFLQIIPLVAVLASSLFIGGLMKGCEKLKYDNEFSLRYLFYGFEKSTAPLLLVGVIYTVGAMICSMLSVSIVEALGYDLQQFTDMTVEQLTLDPTPVLTTLAVFFVVNMGLMIPVLMAFWFAPGLVMLYQLKPVEAMKKSFYACNTNMMPFMVFGLVAFGWFMAITFIVILVTSIIPGLPAIAAIVMNLIFLAIATSSIFISLEDIFGIVPSQRDKRNQFDSEQTTQDHSADDDDDDDSPSQITL